MPVTHGVAGSSPVRTAVERGDEQQFEKAISQLLILFVYMPNLQSPINVNFRNLSQMPRITQNFFDLVTMGVAHADDLGSVEI